MKRVAQTLSGPHSHWVGDGFPVRTYFSYQDGPEISPFLLLDYAGPMQFQGGTQRRGVGPHPHRGFETVTLVYQGEVEHRDSAGHGGRIGPGEVQWMTAGAGVVHEEMHGREFTRAGGTLEMIQLWVNLPARNKMTPARYQDLTLARIPSVDLPGGGVLRVIAGAHEGVTGPAQTFTPVLLWDLTLPGQASADLTVPDGHTCMVLAQTGSVRVDADTILSAKQLAMLDRAGTSLHLQAEQAPARVLVLGGAPIEEPVVGYGPFVMNSQAEIRRALADFQAGRMGSLEAADS